MNKNLVLEQYAKHLYVKAGQFNLYVCFRNGRRKLNNEKLTLEMEGIKQIILNIESEIQNRYTSQKQ